MEVLVGIILAKPLKTTSGEKTVWSGSHRFVAARKLHCLVEPMHLGVLALAKRPRDVNAEIGG